jgi:hypothetical protein
VSEGTITLLWPPKRRAERLLRFNYIKRNFTHGQKIRPDSATLMGIHLKKSHAKESI